MIVRYVDLDGIRIWDGDWRWKEREKMERMKEKFFRWKLDKERSFTESYKKREKES